jgi:FIMAH domain
MQARQRFSVTVGKTFGLLALTLALASPARAIADTTFSFTATDSGSGTFSYGLLQASDNGDGTFTATGGYLIVISGPIVGTYDLFPNPNPPAPFFSPSGAFLVDDILYPGQNPTLDVFGLLFTGNGLEINIWNDGGGVPYTYFAFNGSSFVLASNEAAGFTLASTAAQRVQLLQTIVQALVDNGETLPANGNSLEAKLNAALDSVNRGNANAAIGQLNAFINQVNAFIQNGTLDPELGQSLIDQASATIQVLGG